MQRGVVQNEKRQDDNQPGGLVEYIELSDALFPAGHPYHHTTIGSMTDLDAASLADVKNWFRSHYGPNNAVLVLAGDIDVPTAQRDGRAIFRRHPARARHAPGRQRPCRRCRRPVDEVMHDRVATTTIKREWAVPGVQ